MSWYSLHDIIVIDAARAKLFEAQCNLSMRQVGEDLSFSVELTMDPMMYAVYVSIYVVGREREGR